MVLNFKKQYVNSVLWLRAQSACMYFYDSSLTKSRGPLEKKVRMYTHTQLGTLMGFRWRISNLQSSREDTKAKIKNL